MAKKHYLCKKKNEFKPITLSPGVEKALRDKKIRLEQKELGQKQQRQPGPEPRGMLPGYSCKKVERILAGELTFEKGLKAAEPLILPNPTLVFSRLQVSRHGRPLHSRAVKVASFTLMA